MDDRSDRVPLPADMTRCEPCACDHRTSCARAMASIPRGTPVTDYAVMSALFCTHFVPLGVDWSEPEPAKEVKPWPNYT